MEYLKQHYSRLETDELIKMRNSELTDAARAVLEAELQSRDGTEDAVDSQVRRSVVPHAIDISTIAPLWRRFVAGGIDYGGALLVITAISFAAYVLTPKLVSDLVGYALLLVFFVYLFFRDAMPRQSFGKRLMGIKVLQVNTGELCSLPHSFMRNLFHTLWLIDWVFALGSHSRRLGDLAAGTYVAKA